MDKSQEGRKINWLFATRAGLNFHDEWAHLISTGTSVERADEFNIKNSLSCFLLLLHRQARAAA